MTATHLPPGFERHSWDHVWMNTALAVSKRSGCVKAQCGAVIARDDNRVLSVGYNGPPTRLPATCAAACPRAIAGDLDASYDSCISIHAEANAIMHCSRDDREGATLYVTTTICFTCAKLIANSGITRVVMRVLRGDAHRMPERTIAFLQQSGLKVDVWGSGLAEHRQVFFESYGFGPHWCCFCGAQLAWVEVVHHEDGDHKNNAPSNLRASHQTCHTSHHVTGTRQSETTVAKVHSARATCPTCGKESTRAGIGRHRKASGH